MTTVAALLLVAGHAMGEESVPEDGAMTAKVRAFVCAQPGHEDALPLPRGREIADAVDREVRSGWSLPDAVRRLEARACTPPAGDGGTQVSVPAAFHE